MYKKILRYKSEYFSQSVLRYWFYGILCCCLFSCGKGVPNGQHLPLEKLDSIKIPEKNRFIIHDILSKSRTYLIEITGNNTRYFLGDFDHDENLIGLRIEAFSDEFGSLIAPLKIIGEDSILAVKSKGYTLHDFSGQVISKVKSVKEINPPSKLEMSLEILRIGDSFLYPFSKEINSHRNVASGLDKDIFIWLNPFTGELKSFLQIPRKSLFRNGRFFFKAAEKPVFTLTEGFIHVVFGIESVIYSFSSFPPYDLKDMISLDLPDYRKFEGWEKEKSALTHFNLPFVYGRIEGMFKIGDYFLLSYIPGLDPVQYREYQRAKSTEEQISLTRELKRKVSQKIVLVDSQGKVVYQVDADGLDPNTLLIRNGEIWMKEVKEDGFDQGFSRLFRVGLQNVATK